MHRIKKYRGRNDIDGDNALIGCIILAEPFFFEKKDWIPVPEDWSSSIVQGKTYKTNTEIGKRLYHQVVSCLSADKSINNQNPRFATSLTAHRLGQGAFRVVVTEAYQRRCAITGEKTLPVLQAAHIKPYTQDGPHDVKNGLLLRSDLHTLFDDGYLTLTNDLFVEVSRRLNQDYGNGKDCYKYHGQKLQILPSSTIELPSREFITSHNENCYKG